MCCYQFNNTILSFPYTILIMGIYSILISFKNMDKDYYEILCIDRAASPQIIADSYRKLALRWHPNIAKEDAATSQYHFLQVSEAYEVLSDPIKRAFFDKHGWKKLKEGLYLEGGLKGGYRFGDNAEEIFQEFFHSNDILGQVFDKKIANKGSMFGQAFGALNYQNGSVNPDVIIEVNCELWELYKGGPKKIEYGHQKLNPDGRTLSTLKTTKQIQIKPGFSEKNILVFEGQGNQTISKSKSNLICKIVQIPHKMYSRQGNNLIYTADISLADSLSCAPIQLSTLDNRKLRVSLDEIASPISLKQVPKEGMPIVSSPQQRGNLFIKFNIRFPKILSQEVKKQIRELLQ